MNNPSNNLTSKTVKHKKLITKKEIVELFQKPIAQASLILGISTTQLKRLCREYGIKRWPYRTV